MLPILRTLENVPPLLASMSGLAPEQVIAFAGSHLVNVSPEQIVRVELRHDGTPVLEGEIRTMADLEVIRSTAGTIPQGTLGATVVMPFDWSAVPGLDTVFAEWLRSILGDCSVRFDGSAVVVEERGKADGQNRD